MINCTLIHVIIDLVYSKSIMHYYNVFISDGDDDKLFTLELDSIDKAEIYKVAETEFTTLGYLRPWFIVSIQPKRGGRRKGAGRKSEGRPPKTMPRRVPTEWADKISQVDGLLAMIEDWRDRLVQTPGSDTSPRWERMREFLKEVDELGI
jgi:hypothetical protein